MNSYRQSNPMFLILLLLITVMFVVWVWNGTPSAKQVEISATDLYKALNDDKVREINVNASEVMGVFIDGKNFKTHVADVSALEKAALAKGVKFTVTPETNSGWSMILWLAIGVVVVFVLMFLFAGRSRGSSSSDVPNSGMHNKLASQEQGAERPTVRNSDVAGCEEAIEDLKEVVEFLDEPRDLPANKNIRTKTTTTPIASHKIIDQPELVSGVTVNFTPLAKPAFSRALPSAT